MSTNAYVPRGFTLTELLVVIAVIAMLMGLITTGGTVAQRRAREYQARTMIASLEAALSMYHVDYGSYPDSDNRILVDALADYSAHGTDAQWHGPYMNFKAEDLSAAVTNDGEVLDPWRNPYRYHFDATEVPPYKIWSAGPDGADDSGGDDDIASW